MDELEQLKKVLRALVVSSPCQVDMFSLLRDYRQMMGGHIPLAKFGYREPLSFLKERFNDCFVFHGDMKNPILTPIVTEELKHIDKFVQNQKKNAAVKFKGKRRSIEPTKRPPAANYEPDLIVKTFNKCTINADQNTTNNTSPTPEKPVENHTNNHHRQKSPESQVITRKSPEIIIDKETNTNNKPKDNSSNNAVHSFLKRKTCLYNSQYLDSESAVNGNLLSMDDDSGRQTSSSNSIRKSIALEELKQEVVDLVASSEGGVWCTDLLRLYRERHGRELNFGRFGFTSIISLVSVLDSRLALTRPDDTGDWLLRPLQHAQHAPQLAQHAPLPQQAPPARQYRPARTQKTSNNVDPDDALPGIDFDPDVFPVDCMHFMESIPSLSLSAIEPGALLEVMVGEVYSPSHFWLIRLGEQYHIAMEQIMDEMNEYYTSGEGRDRQLALGAVRVGHYCSSLFDRDWHRSLIVKVIDSDTVKVRHVDYGTVDRVSVRALKPLLRSCARLPAMALRARLAGVRPGAAGRRWPHAASTRFLDKVRDTNFVASVVAVDREEDILEVFLVNTSTDVDDDVSADLIRSGHADPRRDSCVRVSPALCLDDDDHDVRSLLTAISQFHNDDACSEVSASASELVGRQPKRLPTWECPTPEEYLSPDENHFLDTDFRSLLVGSCEENMMFNSAPKKPVVARPQQNCKNLSPPAHTAPDTPSPPQSVLLAKIRSLHPVPRKEEGNGVNNIKSETPSVVSDDATSVASFASRRLARIRALHAKIPADKITPSDSLCPGISPALTPTSKPSNLATLTSNIPTSNHTTAHDSLSLSKPPIDLLCASTPLTASNPLPPVTPSLPRSVSSTSSDSADTVATSVTSLVLRRRLALANKLRKDALT